MRLLGLLVLWCWSEIAVGECESSLVKGGRLFSCQLTALEFFGDLQEDTTVQFEASLRDHVGLPSWLNLFQPSLNSPAYLYGTAPVSNETLVVLINALRKDTFNSKVKEFNLKIESAKEGPMNSTQLFITNQNVDDFLRPSNMQLFKTTSTVAFNTATVSIAAIQSPASIGVPVPPPPMKHGAVVAVLLGEGVAVSRATDRESALVQGKCNDGVGNPPPENFVFFEQNGYAIDWCQYEVEVVQLGEGLNISKEEGRNVEGVEVSDGERGSVPLVLVVIVCLVAVVGVVVTVGYAMFGGRRQSCFRKQSGKLTILQLTRAEASKPHTIPMTTLTELSKISHEKLEPAGHTTVEDTPSFISPDPDVSMPTSPPPPYQYPQNLLQ